jgi:hypothetical protein
MLESNFSFKCNCPDASKRTVAGYRGKVIINTDWSGSNAGAQNGECKHVWAVKRFLNIIKEIPTDIPIQYQQEDRIDDRARYSSNANYGNVLIGNNTFGFYDGEIESHDLILEDD